jgi:hypothetical protein
VTAVAPAAALAADPASRGLQQGGLPTLIELLSAGAPPFALTLVAVGGVVWLVAYLAAIRTAARDRAPALPVVAVCLNLTWELLHSVVHRPPRTVDFVTNLAWLALDVVILYQILRFGARHQAIPALRRHFPLAVAAALVLSFAGHLTFHRYSTANAIFPDESGAIPAFVINLVMSILFVAMYFARPDGAGLSKTVAWAKFLGSGLYAVGNTIVMAGMTGVRYEVQVRPAGTEEWNAAGIVGSGTIDPGFLYFLFIAIALFDVLYLWLLYRGPHRAGRGAGPPAAAAPVPAPR